MSDDGPGAAAADDPAPSAPDTASKGSGDAADDSGAQDRQDRLGGTGAARSADAFDALAQDAYERGRRVLDPTTVIAGRDAHVNIRTQLLLSRENGAGRTTGRMQDDHLASVQARYVPVPDYEYLEKLLTRRRLLVLTGQPATGRTTTAIRLLDSVSDRRVSRLDPRTPVVDLGDDDVEAEHGYLATIADADSRVSAVGADRLADLLGRHSAYCVLVVADQAEAAGPLSAYAVRCPPPDPLELIAAHVDADLPPDAPLDLLERLKDVAASPRMRAALGPAPRTDEAAGMAQLLLSHGRGEIDLDDVEAALAAFLDDQIARWFAVLDAPGHGERGERARRLSALRIALAVFDDLPAHLATTTAELLAERLGAPATRAAARPASPLPTVGRPRALTGVDDRNLVASTRLVQERRSAAFRGLGDVPADVLRFADRRTPAALLRHVWANRPALRRPLLTWLDDLARDPRYVVRVRAAQATGLLCSVDFQQTYTELIEPAAHAVVRRPPASDRIDGESVTDDAELWFRRRQFAAIALDHAARDPALHQLVTRTLKRWRRGTEPAPRWTAALALGYDLGHDDVAATLEELRVLGTPQEGVDLAKVEDEPLLDDWWGLLWAAAVGVARLFATGAHEPVLQMLAAWMEHHRLSLRMLAVESVLVMMELPVSGLRPAERSATDDVLFDDLDVLWDRGRWPALLALQERHAAVVAPAADLLRAALRSRWRGAAAQRLERWFDLCVADVTALPAVESFLPLLVVEESDRDRLRSLVRRKRRVWADPLPPDVADRLDAALLQATVVPRGRRVVYT